MFFCAIVPFLHKEFEDSDIDKVQTTLIIGQYLVGRTNIRSQLCSELRFQTDYKSLSRWKGISAMVFNLAYMPHPATQNR